MKLFAKFLRYRRKQIFAAVLFWLLFLFSFLLYRLPLAAMVYPLLLTLLIGICFLAADFCHELRIHRQLSFLKKQTADAADNLPAPESIVEEDDHELLLLLRKQLSALDSENKKRFEQTVDYYTVWAHQIKTPIASMRLTLQQEDSPSARRLLSDLSRIEQYVEMVMAFLRLDSRDSDFVFREYPLDALIKRSVRRFSSEFIARKIALDYEPTDEVLITDEKWFCFVLEQLLSNALKYTKRGQIRLYSLAPHTLCVEDTGIGIAPEDLPRIFEKGYTGQNGRRDLRASGIGLYLCRRVCGALGITLSASSEPNVGTVMTLCWKEHSNLTET